MCALHVFVKAVIGSIGRVEYNKWIWLWPQTYYFAVMRHRSTTRRRFSCCGHSHTFWLITLLSAELCKCVSVMIHRRSTRKIQFSSWFADIFYVQDGEPCKAVPCGGCHFFGVCIEGLACLATDCWSLGSAPGLKVYALWCSHNAFTKLCFWFLFLASWASYFTPTHASIAQANNIANVCRGWVWHRSMFGVACVEDVAQRTSWKTAPKI